MAEPAYRYDYGNPAPKRAPEKKPQQKKSPELKVVKSKNRILIENEEKANRTVYKLSALCLVAFLLFGLVTVSYAQLNDNRHDYETKKAAYMEVEDENKFLKSQLAALASADRVKNYAEKKLGMIKADSGNRFYLNSEKDNRVIYFEDKN